MRLPRLWLPGVCLLLVLALPAVAMAQPPARDLSSELRIGPNEIARLFIGLPGIPMWALVVCAVLTVAFAVERLVVLSARRVSPSAFTRRVLEHLRDEPLTPALVRELQAACHKDGSPAAALLRTVIEHHGRTALEIRTAVSDVADLELFGLRRRLRGLAGLAATAPLLGLFGTVIGMIEAFQALSQHTGAGRSEVLAAGIGLALVATAMGLAVAILGSLAYYLLQGKSEQRIHELDVLVNQAVVLVASDSFREQPRGAAKPAGSTMKVQHAVG